MARRKEKRRDRLYRAYVTDALKVYINLDTRYEDIANKKPVKPADPEVIKANIKAKLKKLGE